MSEHWKKFISSVSNKLEINKKVIIKISKNVSSPLTIGIFKPIILIPFASMNSLSVEQMEVVIIHELAHIKRQDYFINLLLIVIDVFMFFNPFSTSIKKQIVLERELCCDDVVIRENYSSRVYAQALLNIAKLQLNTCNNNISIYAVSSKKELKYRVNRILGLESKKYQSSFYKIFAALFIGTSFFFLQFHVPFKSEKIEWKINNVAKFQFAKNTFENKKIDNSTNRIVKQKSIKVKPGTKNNLELAYTKTELFKAEKKEMIESLVALGKAENKNNFEFILNQETNSNLEELRKSENNNTIEIISAVEKYPIITTQKFFIPATSSSAASIIIVTTSENEKGNKTVKIEIAKGSSRIE